MMCAPSILSFVKGERFPQLCGYVRKGQTGRDGRSPEGDQWNCEWTLGSLPHHEREGLPADQLCEQHRHNKSMEMSDRKVGKLRKDGLTLRLCVSGRQTHRLCSGADCGEAYRSGEEEEQGWSVSETIPGGSTEYFRDWRSLKSSSQLF